MSAPMTADERAWWMEVVMGSDDPEALGRLLGRLMARGREVEAQ